MDKQQLDQFFRDWDFENNGIPQEDSTLPARLEIMTYRTLAEGEPVSTEHLAAAADVPLEIVNVLFEEGKQMGGEWDAAGRLLGNVLTLLPTPHQFNVNGKNLYTWCSMDAIFLPALLAQTAEVRSVDPVSGEEIKLTIPPEGNPAYDPPTTVLSIVLSAGDRSGPESPLCRQMHFFRSRENADIWVKDHPDAAVMSVEEVYSLVREYVIAPNHDVLEQLRAGEV